MKKKLISLVSALLIATVALTGCGSSSTEGSQSTNNSQTATESQAQTRLDKIKEAGVIVVPVVVLLRSYAKKRRR